MTTQNNNLIDSLRSLSLSENAAKIYLANLELGPSSIWEISKKSGIKRPTCYVILEELSWKGIASNSNNGKRIEYSVISPKQLAQREESRHNKIINSISELQAIASKSPLKPKIRTFEGDEGIKQTYDLILEMPKNSDTYVLGINLFDSHLDDMISEFVQKRVKKSIKTIAIFPDTPENRLRSIRKKDLREVRFLPLDIYNPKSQVNIFGDSVAYVAHMEKEPFATVIESQTIASDEIQRFKMLWKIAKE